MDGPQKTDQMKEATKSYMLNDPVNKKRPEEANLQKENADPRLPGAVGMEEGVMGFCSVVMKILWY